MFCMSDFRNPFISSYTFFLIRSSRNNVNGQHSSEMLGVFFVVVSFGGDVTKAHPDHHLNFFSC